MIVSVCRLWFTTTTKNYYDEFRLGKKNLFFVFSSEYQATLCTCVWNTEILISSAGDHRQHQASERNKTPDPFSQSEQLYFNPHFYPHVCVDQCTTGVSLSVQQVLVYDLLIGHGVKCGGAWKTIMLKHRSRLQSALARIKVKRKVSRNQDLLPSSFQQTQGNVGINYYEWHNLVELAK